MKAGAGVESGGAAEGGDLGGAGGRARGSGAGMGPALALRRGGGGAGGRPERRTAVPLRVVQLVCGAGSVCFRATSE